jgi:hypothetical protein
MKLLALCIGILALPGCASHPEQERLEVDQSAGVPMGLAWMPSSNEVVVSVGGIEHVLLPGARNAARTHASRATATKEASNDAVQPVRPPADGQRIDQQEVRDPVPSASQSPQSSSGRRAHDDVGDACPIVE